jgi:hypothetical protein
LVAAVVAAGVDEFLGGGEVVGWSAIGDEFSILVLALFPRVSFLTEEEAGAVEVDEQGAFAGGPGGCS